jgi:hypothetical protein
MSETNGSDLQLSKLNPEAPAPKLPRSGPCPVGLGYCKDCVKWDTPNISKVMVTNQGLVKVADAIKAGLPVRDVLTVAHCCDTPVRNFTTDDHWCWQYMGPMARVRDRPVPA